MSNAAVRIGQLPQDFLDALVGLDEETAAALTTAFVKEMKGDAHEGTHSGTREGLQAEYDAACQRAEKLGVHLDAAIAERDALGTALAALDDQPAED